MGENNTLMYIYILNCLQAHPLQWCRNTGTVATETLSWVQEHSDNLDTNASVKDLLPSGYAEGVMSSVMCQSLCMWAGPTLLNTGASTLAIT